MIESYIVFLTLIGAISSLTTWLVVTSGKEPRHLPVMILVGLTSGLFMAIVWANLTGALDITINVVAITAIISSTLSLIVLYYIPLPKLVPRYGRGTWVAWIILMLLTMLFAYNGMAPTYPTTLSSTQFTAVDLDSISYSDRTPNPVVPVSIDGAVSSVKLFSTSETPTAGDYLKFRVTFTISTADWTEPYITLAVYKDNNNDSTYDTGDTLLPDNLYKVATGNSKWRANVIYDDNPHEIFANDNGVVLPIFHANSISRWMDDTQYELSNTPEKFTPTHDMLSWDSNGELKENVLTYASIPSGTTTAIEGKIYCQEQGQYYILVRAYDARFATPYETGQPLAEKLIPFAVIPSEGDGGGGTPSFSIDWILLLGLLAVTIPAVGIMVTRRW